ncbi:MAG: ACT domain-containing protein [Candidatus Riflebacteria bacterium]|nr:ACT domain-containing protein [Candidatus Riflebacteria bacterium]
MSEQRERVVITVLGANKPGILAGVTRIVADAQVNVDDISQKVMQDLFALMLITDFSHANCTFEEFQGRLQKGADEMKVRIFAQHEDVFKFMHRV